MHEPQRETITPNPELESTAVAYTRDKPGVRALYTGTGLTLDYALAKAVDDALGLPDRARKPGDSRPIRNEGDTLEVVHWEVKLGNGHVPDHIVYLG